MESSQVELNPAWLRVVLVDPSEGRRALMVDVVNAGGDRALLARRRASTAGVPAAAR